MYKPSTHLIVSYLFSLPIYLYTRPISYKIGYQGESKYLTQLRFIEVYP
jgi:hypothetical protein